MTLNRKLRWVRQRLCGALAEKNDGVAEVLRLIAAIGVTPCIFGAKAVAGQLMQGLLWLRKDRGRREPDVTDDRQAQHHLPSLY